jgi:hypothetical protein
MHGSFIALHYFGKVSSVLNFTGVIVNFSCSVFEIGVECIVVVEHTWLTVL